MNALKPTKLRPGDLVGICSPSGTITHKQELFAKARVNFEQATGLKTVVAPNAFAKHFYSAGTGEERLADFHGLIANPDVKAIIFSAGGDTAIDLLPRLDFDLIRKNPKIMAGISDATTLLSAITATTGLITFLGLEWLDFAEHAMTYELESIKKAWFKGTVGMVEGNPRWRDLHNTPTTYKSWQMIRGGAAEGQLIGGNAESFIQLLGTSYEFLLPESILFLETYKLPKKQIHKLLMQLKLRGVFENVRGMIVGYCLDCDNPEIRGNEQPIEDLVREITADFDFPIMHLGEIGHYVENFLQPLGVKVRVDATTLEVEILEHVTE